jgi:hypothetical protein
MLRLMRARLGGAVLALVMTLSVGPLPSWASSVALTLSPSSARPLESVAISASGFPSQACQQEPRYENRYIPVYESVPVRDLFGNILYYEQRQAVDENGNLLYQVVTTVTYVTTCVTNTVVVRLGVTQVAIAPVTGGGISTTFAVPNVAPGTYEVTATGDDGTVASGTFTVLETTPPAISATVSPSPNANGWNSTDATVTFVCVDGDSGISSCSPPVTVSAEGLAMSVTGTAIDNAGNSASLTVNVSIDRTAPTITPRASRVPDHGAWYTAPVTITFDCVDTLSGVALCSGPVTFSHDGRSVIFMSEAFDNAGNGLSFAGTVNIDTTPPSIVAPPNVVTGTAAGACAASPALGTAVATDNLGSVSVSVATPASFPKGSTNVTWTATDPAGHTAHATQTVTVNDTEPPMVVAPPAVTVTTTSASGAVIATSALGSAIASDNCAGATVAVVSGIPAGNVFPIGTSTLTWTATDASGNIGSATQRVTVAHNICLLYDPARAAKLGSTIPIKFQLCAAGGTNLSSASLVPHATQIVRTGSATSTLAEDSGNANADSDFRYDTTLGGTGGYIYNLSTNGLASGSWELLFTVNGQIHSVPFQVK